jgi:hypothetical protein
VEETLRYIAVSACLVHLDNYIGVGHNTYFYEVNGRFSVIPWDMNETFGTYNAGIRKDGIINYYIDEPTACSMKLFPLVDRLLAYPPYFEQYRGYVKEFIEGPYSLDVILPRLDRLVELIRPYVKADTEMLYTYDIWERCLTEDLRPPDVFEGWMAGGQSPPLPWTLGYKETAALKQNFRVNSLWELFSFKFTDQDIITLRECLTREHADAFLQNVYGPLMAPQPPHQPGFGNNSLGLRMTIIARHKSIEQQLSGERPSGPLKKGSGNGGSTYIIDMM